MNNGYYWQRYYSGSDRMVTVQFTNRVLRDTLASENIAKKSIDWRPHLAANCAEMVKILVARGLVSELDRDTILVL